jgi:hypothetical protein
MATLFKLVLLDVFRGENSVGEGYGGGGRSNGEGSKEGRSANDIPG